MSPSLTRAGAGAAEAIADLRRRAGDACRRVEQAFLPRASVGLVIGAESICAAHVVADADGRRVEEIRTEALPVRLFGGAPTATMQQALAGALEKIGAGFKDAYLPVHVALPDPVIQLVVFELEDLPKTKKSRAELVRWRLAKEFHAEGQPLDCAHQDLGAEDGKRLLLGQAGDGSWLAALKQALRDAGITPWTINAGVCHRFNRFHDRFASEANGGALIALDPEWWTLSVWDREQRLRLARGRWRDGAAGNDGYEAIAADTERTILSYVRGGVDRAIGRVFIAGEAPAIAGLSAALARRMRDGPVALSAGADFADAPAAAESGYAPLALAAAVS